MWARADKYLEPVPLFAAQTGRTLRRGASVQAILSNPALPRTLVTPALQARKRVVRTPVRRRLAGGGDVHAARVAPTAIKGGPPNPHPTLDMVSQFS